MILKDKTFYRILVYNTKIIPNNLYNIVNIILIILFFVFCFLFF